MGLGTANQWRADEGEAALSYSGSMYSGACSWATHLAQNDTIDHQFGQFMEVAAQNWGSCATLWSNWRNSSGHYNAIVSDWHTVGGFACVQRSDGKVWGVGRVN